MTIAAISTALGHSGIGVIRISGPQSLKILQKLIKNVSRETFSHKIYHGQVYDGANILDDVIYYYLKSPHSYTGEDMAEISCHGSPAIMKAILSLAIKHGAHQAYPGEFTKRAFLTGKLDLAQAEAVADLISSQSAEWGRVAIDQLTGMLSRRVEGLRAKVLQSLANLEAIIDFPDDIENVSYGDLKHDLSQYINEIDGLLSTSKYGKLLRNGISAAIVGRPNVGKSSLLNALLGEPRAIVSSEPGTTRDIIEEQISISGLCVRIIDTAGIRVPHSEVEEQGVNRSRHEWSRADLVLLVVDGSVDLQNEDQVLLNAIDPKKTLVVINKMDICFGRDRSRPVPTIDGKSIFLSAKTGDGLDELKRQIPLMMGGDGVFKETVLINQRHEGCLLKAKESLLKAIESITISMPVDFISIDLRSAVANLGEVTGVEVGREVVDRIFEGFCVGK